MPLRVPLVALVAMVMTVSTCHACTAGPCNVDGRTPVNVNVGRFTGVWYLKAASKVIDRYQTLTGYKAEVTSEQDDQGNTVLQISITSSSTGREACSSNSFRCILNGDTCTAIGFDHAFTIVTIDYDTVFGHWSETTEDNKCYEILSLYVRNPTAQTDLSNIRSDLQQYCGADATNPSSSFYEVQLSYDNVPSCIISA